MDWVKIVKAVDAARIIDVAFFDADGVIFPAKTTAGTSIIGKEWCYNDGQGISLLRAIGVHIVFITSETGDAVHPIQLLVERWNNLPSARVKDGWSPVNLYTGKSGEGKVEAAQFFLNTVAKTFNTCSYMGDDLVDVPLMRHVAFPVVPHQAEKVVADMALFKTDRNGGSGAIRDFAEFILACRGIDSIELPSR